MSSLCRCGRDRARAAMQREQRRRLSTPTRLYSYYDNTATGATVRRKSTRSIAQRVPVRVDGYANARTAKPRFCFSTPIGPVCTQRIQPSLTRATTHHHHHHPSSTTKSLYIRSLASLATNNGANADGNNRHTTSARATAIAVAVAAAAMLLGGSYNHQRNQQQQQQPDDTEKIGETRVAAAEVEAAVTVATNQTEVLSAVSGAAAVAVETKTKTGTPSRRISASHRSRDDCKHNAPTTENNNNNNNNHVLYSSTFRPLPLPLPLLNDLLEGIQTSAASAIRNLDFGSTSTGASTSAEPLQRQAVKNPIAAAAQFHNNNNNHNHNHQQPRNVMISRMRSVAGRGLHEKYKVDWNTVLGEGAYGSVHPARLALTGEKVALKKISKRYTDSSDFFMETDALLRIYDNGGHPNISGLRDMYEDYKHYYLVMDLITGGELFDHLSNDGAYSEADAARLIFEISSALAFMHGVGVIHCDIKPENLMLCSRKRRGGTIKIIDFGCAITQPVGHYDDNNGGNTNSSSNDGGSGGDTGTNKPGLLETGTTGYWPPERFMGERVTPAVDTWALGIILYIMLMGFHPFDINCDRSDEEVALAIQENPLPPMDEVYVGHLSESAKDLIRRLMEPDPSKRMTAYELLHHPWVQGETATTEVIEDSDKRLSKFQDLRYKLEASVFAVLVNQGHQDLTMSEAKRRNTVTNKNGSSGVVSIMKSAFDVFDGDGKGYVTGEDIGKVVTERTGEVIKTHDANEFLKVKNKDLEVSLSNFSNLFSGMKHKHFPRGHYIFHAGDEGRSMYFLSSGKVEVQTRKGQLVAMLRSGDFFGEGSLLDDSKKRFTTAKCATPVDVVEIKREDFDRYTRSSIDTKNELKRKWRARSLVYAKNLLRLEQSVKARTLSKGDVVYHEGDKGTAMYRVDDTMGGELEVLHGDIPVHKYVAGDSFGESSLLFDKPRSSTVRCITDTCRIHEMSGEDFMTVLQSSPDSADSFRNMCRKRLFKRAVKQFSLETNRGLNDDDIVAAFHNADEDNSGYLSVEDVRRIMHRMDPKFPMSEIHELMKFVDVDEDGRVDINEFKQIFRQFEDEKA